VTSTTTTTPGSIKARGPCFNSPARYLGVQVGDLFQLERPLERGRIADVAPEKKKSRVLANSTANSAAALSRVEYFTHDGRHVA
jgi:hypothetical protein